ncbi:hypothetical protein B0H14DRAFT_2600275 [Mycena olivaceomarginata]|nr:hypothetical protein B0H14DRAFT_2600275 [Mycena olivaceomarginata]
MSGDRVVKNERHNYQYLQRDQSHPVGKRCEAFQSVKLGHDNLLCLSTIKQYAGLVDRQCLKQGVEVCKEDGRHDEQNVGQLSGFQTVPGCSIPRPSPFDTRRVGSVGKRGGTREKAAALLGEGGRRRTLWMAGFMGSGRSSVRSGRLHGKVPGWIGVGGRFKESGSGQAGWLFSFSTSEAWAALQLPKFLKEAGPGFLASDLFMFAISRVNEKAVVFVSKFNLEANSGVNYHKYSSFYM